MSVYEIVYDVNNSDCLSTDISDVNANSLEMLLTFIFTGLFYNSIFALSAIISINIDYCSKRFVITLITEP